MKFKVLFVFAVVLVLGIAFALMWFRNHGRKIQQYDRMIAEEVQEAVETHFSTLQPADPISQRYGKFIELVGSGYERGTLFGSTPKIRLERTARFEKASIRCPIEVFNRGPAKLHLRLQPSAEWMSKNPEHKLVIRGNELILVGPNSTGSTELSIGVTHPRFYWDVFDLAEAKSLDAEVEGIVDDMVASVADKNPAESSVVQDWYNSQRRSEPVEQFLMRSLEHPNPEIGVEAIRLLGTATNGRRVSLSDGALNQLLSLIANEERNEAQRLEAVRTYMQLYETDREKLYDELRDLGVRGHFAIPVLADFMNDRSHRNWQSGGDFDAPTGAAELLEGWGPASSEAGPVLVAILKEHPNRWDYAPAAARALGAIGPNANSAIEQLQLSRSDRSSKLRQAANEALAKIADPGEFSVERILSFTDENEQKAFYPLIPATTHYWASSDGQFVYLMQNDKNGGRLYRIAIDTGQCERVLDLDSTFPASAVDDGDNFHVLRLLRDQDEKSVVVDTWSLTQKERIDQRILYKLPAVQTNEKKGINYVVWSGDRKLVAFTHWVSKPHGKGHTESRLLQVRQLDQPQVSSDARVDEYLMTPVCFSGDNQTLFMTGHSFAAGSEGIAAFDVESRKSVPVLSSARCITPMAVHRSKSNWIPIHQRSEPYKGAIELLDTESSKVQKVSLESEATHLFDPWESAVAVSEDGRQLAVLTHHSLDWYNIATGEFQGRSGIFLPKGRIEVVPLMVQFVNCKVIVVGMSNNGSTRRRPSVDNPLWVRAFSMDVNK